VAHKKVSNLARKAKPQRPANVIPFATPPIPIRAGMSCGSVGEVYLAAKDHLADKSYTKLTILYLDQVDRLLDVRSERIGKNAGAVSLLAAPGAELLRVHAPPGCRSAVGILSSSTVEYNRRLRGRKDRDLEKEYRGALDGLARGFLAAQIKLIDLYLYNDSRLFRVQNSEWYSFQPAPDLSSMITPARPKNTKTTFILRDEEELRLLMAFRSLSPTKKELILLTVRTCETMQAEHDDIYQEVKAGHALTDDRANTWAWLRDDVLSGKFHPKTPCPAESGGKEETRHE